MYGRKTSKAAFTLVEMLVVIAIVTLAVTMAIPAIRFLTGSRSEAAAGNTLSSYIGYARNDATMQVRGVLLYLDDDDRVKAIEVQQSLDSFSTTDVPGVVYLDIAGAVYPPAGSVALTQTPDSLSLPAGIRVWTLNDDDPVSGMYSGSRYLGFNPVSDFTGGTSAKPNMRIGGVVLFGTDRRLIAARYGFRFVTHQLITGTRMPTALGQMFSSDGTATFNPDVWPSSGNNHVLRAAVGLVMFDKEAFLNAVGGDGNKDSPNPNIANNWLDANASPSFINRYSGAVMPVQ